jgi:predicted RNase H-like HicB family nuclease
MTKQEILQEALARVYPIEAHQEDGSEVVFAFHPDFDSCGAIGNTLNEALVSLDKVRMDLLERLVNEGAEIPKPSNAFIFKFISKNVNWPAFPPAIALYQRVLPR